MKIQLSNNEIMKSVIRFVIFYVPENTKETEAELYMRWKEISKISITNPSTVVSILEFLENQKCCDREAIVAAALIDEYITQAERDAWPNNILY